MRLLKLSTIILRINSHNYNLAPILRYVFIISFILFFPTFFFAQHLQPSFKNFTVDDGPPSSEVYVAIQDNDGYMWFGTDNGLSRFDGYEFINYGIPDGLTDLVVFDLKLDKDGKLWIMTMTGKVFIYDGKIKPYVYNHIIQEYANDFIYAKNMYVEDGELTICLELVGILTIDQKGNSQLLHSSEQINSVSIIYNDSQLMSFAIASKDPEKVNTLREELNKAHRSVPIIITSNQDSATHSLIKNSTDGIGNSSVSINSETILLNSEGTTALIQSNNLKWQRDEEITFHDVYIDHKNNIWIGLHSKKGIRIFNNTDDLKSNNYRSILQGASISKIYEDLAGGLWVTSIDKGVFFSSSHERGSNLTGNGLYKMHISGITMSRNHLYIVTRDLSYYSYDLSQNKLVILPGIPQSVRQKGVNTSFDIFYSLSNENLFGGIGSLFWSKNNWRLMTDSITQKRTKHLPKNISSNEFRNNILTHTANEISQINTKSETRIQLIRGLGKWTTCANYDHTGNRWVGREDGVWLWVNDTLIRPEKTPVELKNRIDAIEFDDNNNLVVGTKGNGIILWDRKESVIQITTKDGLTSNIIENIFIDSLQQIWAGTLNGLNKVTVGDEIKVKQFTKKHGLPGNEIVKVRRRGDDIWVATTTGLGKIKDLKENTKTIKPILNRFIVNGSNTSILESNRFPSTDNNISIEYVALDFKALGDITYRYRLHATQDWQEIKNTSINLPDLRSNYYEFEIQAQNEDGYWSESLLIPFQILQPIYARTWFMILAALISVGALGSYLRRRQLREQEIQQNTINQLKQEHATKSQIVELERSALQAQMNPHFIFNILNSIQSAINENEKEMASQTLAKFAKLIRATLKNAKTSTISLEEEISYIESYLYLEQIRFKEEAFQYQVTCSPEIDQYDTLIPPMLVQPFVENAIKHGIKDNRNAIVSVDYNKDGDALIVKVRDNGSGIDKIQHKRNHRSYGMSITQRRLELLNNEDDALETFRIEQLRDSLGEISGTEIIIRINISLPSTNEL